MIKVLDNGQVLKQEIGDTYEQWIPIGMAEEAAITANKTNAAVGETVTVSLAWTKINTTTETWDADAVNQDDFNLVVGDDTYVIPVSTPKKDISFTAKGVHFITTANPGKGCKGLEIVVA